jgi:hypothetical protein
MIFLLVCLFPQLLFVEVFGVLDRFSHLIHLSYIAYIGKFYHFFVVVVEISKIIWGYLPEGFVGGFLSKHDWNVDRF